MQKKDFLKRCETIYDMGLADKKLFKLLADWVDAVMRFEGGQGNTSAHFHQLSYWKRFVEDERKRTDNFANIKTLANDQDGYDIIRLVAVLVHPCQICAEDKTQWHTRSGFCPHKK